VRSVFSREHVFFIVIGIFCFYIIYPYLFPFTLGVACAYLFEPLLEKLALTFRLKRKSSLWALAISLVCVTLCAVIAPILALITTGAQELLSLLNLLENDLKTQNLFNTMISNLSVWLKKLSLSYSPEELILKGSILIKKSASFVASLAGNAIYATPGFLIMAILFILTWCFFLIHGQSYRKIILPQLIPWQKEREVICQTVSSVLRALIVANVLVSCIQAVLVTTVLALFGIPRYALMGIISFFMSFIPIIGISPVVLGAATWCYFNNNNLASAIGILVCGVLISLADNIMRPLFMKGGIELNLFWIFFAIVSGMSQFGISGAVLGPVCFALFVGALQAIEKPKKMTEA
jgi:predicted PurR-regulated permease PerM